MFLAYHTSYYTHVSLSHLVYNSSGPQNCKASNYGRKKLQNISSTYSFKSVESWSILALLYSSLELARLLRHGHMFTNIELFYENATGANVINIFEV